MTHQTPHSVSAGAGATVFRITFAAFTIALIAALAASAFGRELSGRVTDRQGQPLLGVSIVTNISGIGTQTDSTGAYILNVPDEQGGELGAAKVTRLTFSSVGFESRQFRIADVPKTVQLNSIYYRGQDITVAASRAEAGVSPVAYSNYSQNDLKRDYTIGELPLLLNSTPNLYSYSDAGSQLGYSYMSIRGFDDKRISTYINGVPLNDPEDQATYFVDLPDFASTVTDIQVQRGVGNSLYGDASFGGTINIVTNSLAMQRHTTLSTGFGQYTANGKAIGQMSKQTIDYASGLVDGRWQFGGRFSGQKGDGYRYSSWYNGWAYFFSLARLDPNMTTQFHVYGGPMKMHLAYYGAERDSINRDRRLNYYLPYGNETDNFNQPHYELDNNYRLSDKATLSNTLYYIHGRGFYEQYEPTSLLSDYNIDTLQTDIDPGTGHPYTTGDVVRQHWVAKDQIGWNPRLDIEHGKGNHTLGGSFYYFDSDHWGQLAWAQHVNSAQLDPDHRFYEYHGKKWVGSMYAQENYRLTDRLSAQATAEFRYQRYTFNQDRFGAFAGYQYDVHWFFASPRLGFTYSLNNRASLFTNFAISSRTPTDDALYDANDPHALPSLQILDSTIAPGGYKTYTFGQPTAKDERVYNFELGGRYQAPQYAFGVNLFWMEFRDEILPYGGINPSNGIAITINADRSVHSGIELSGDYKPVDPLKLSGNLSFNYNRVKKYSADFPYQVDSAGTTLNESANVDFKNKKLSGFPEYLGNLIVDYQRDWYRLTFREQLVGKQWMELYNIDSLAIKPHAVASLSASASMKNFFEAGTLTLSVRIDNLFNNKFETSGYGGNYAYRNPGEAPAIAGWAEYFVNAERSFYAQLQWELF